MRRARLPEEQIVATVARQNNHVDDGTEHTSNAMLVWEQGQSDRTS